MSVDPGAVGARSEPWTRSWTSDETLLYAVAVGAGPAELCLATENSEGVEQRTLPTYAALLAGGTGPVRDRLGDWASSQLVYAGQTLTWHRPLPTAGGATLVASVAGVTDKGSGALIEIDTEAADQVSGLPLFTSRIAVFVRGAGGFATAQRAAPPSAPDGPDDFRPDGEITVRLPENQALLYRLCGDRNRLHSDPVYAARAGFDRPILHGLCTYGVSARLLLRDVVGGDPDRLTSVTGRFRTPVFPGDELRVRHQRTGPGRIAFRTLRSGSDRPAIDGGELTHTEAT